MLADEAANVAEAVGAREAVLEPKYDGWRVLARVGSTRVDLYTRSGNSLKGLLPEIEDELFAIFPPGTWLDGEAVAIKMSEGRVEVEWGAVQSALGGGKRPKAIRDKVTFVVFDLLSHQEIDARKLPFRERRALLESIFEDVEAERVMLTPQLAATQENYEALVATGFEGAMVKHLDGRYTSGKNGWFKVKHFDSDEAFVIGFKSGKGSNAGKVGALILGQYDEHGNEVKVASVKILDAGERKKITAGGDDYLYRVVEFTFNGRLKSGYRHPQFSRLRVDKSAADCRVNP